MSDSLVFIQSDSEQGKLSGVQVFFEMVLSHSEQQMLFKMLKCRLL